nr:TMV resistance protein N-like [Ipomoea batatas]
MDFRKALLKENMATETESPGKSDQTSEEQDLSERSTKKSKRGERLPESHRNSPMMDVVQETPLASMAEPVPTPFLGGQSSYQPTENKPVDEDPHRFLLYFDSNRKNAWRRLCSGSSIQIAKTKSFLFRNFDSDCMARGFGIGGEVVEGHHWEALVAVGERVGRMVVDIAGDAEGSGGDLAGEARWGLLAEGGGVDLASEARRGLLAESGDVDLGVMRACWLCASWSRMSCRGVDPMLAECFLELVSAPSPESSKSHSLGFKAVEEVVEELTRSVPLHHHENKPKSNGSFAKKISCKQAISILNMKGKPAVRFFKDEWGRLAEIEERVTLVGKFSKGRPPLELIREKFQSTFSLTGSAHVGSLDLRHILIKFSREDDCEKVLAKGLAMVAGKPMRLTRWSPDWSTRKESPLAAVWVELPGLPYHLFDHNSLKHLCRPVGKLLALDSATVRRTRPSVARVKLELDLLKPLVDEIWVGFADEGVDPEVGFWQRLEYENVPSFCSKCFKFGHVFSSCKSGSNRRNKSGEISGSGPVVTPKQSKKRSLKPFGLGLGVGVQTRSMRRKGHRADSISPNSNSNTSIFPLDSTENLQTQSPFLKRNQNTLPTVPLEDTSWASIDHKSPNFSSTIDSNATPSSFPPFSNLVPFSNRARSSAKRALLFNTSRQYRELEGIHRSMVISQSKSELDDEDNDLRSNEVTDLLVGLDYG